MAKVKCPICALEFVRRVSLAGLVEKFLSLFYVYPFKCQLCGHNFLSLQWGMRYIRVEEDRRTYDRLEIKCPMTFSGESGAGEGTVVELSMGGCSVSTSADIVAGMILKMSLKVSSDVAPILVKAAVVRHVRLKAVGVEFLQWERSERERLQQFITGFLIDRQK
jgi:hypothetical protein